MSTVTSFFSRLLDLRQGAQSKQEIINNVKDDTEFSSARFWTLVAAVILASVGLNMNSIPVIIGAMLISPLMGPIVSFGLGLAIEDWGLVRRSAKNLFIQTTISIAISAIYFSITPITNAQSELLARIQPTLFDVLIAVFGGLAGFIGISRARQSNIIPGVAIATALMPPLCTVGYGIGTLQPKFIIGAFYLFLINSIFICLSSLVVAVYMRLPKKEYTDILKRKRVDRIISIVIVIIVVPAIYQAVLVVKQNHFNQNAERYIRSVFIDEGHVVIYKNITYGQKEKTIELAFLSRRVTEEEEKEYEDRFKEYGLEGTDLVIRQDTFALTEEEWRKFVKTTEDDKEYARLLEEQLARRTAVSISPDQLQKEMSAIDNRVVDVAVGAVSRRVETENKEVATVLVYLAEDKDRVDGIDQDMLRNWLVQRLGVENAEIIFMNRE